MTSARKHRAMALDRLRAAMASDARPTPFVGAGVASAVTGGAACASWHGLLLDGIEQCRQSVPVPSGWANRMREHLASADAISYMAVADEIRRRLEARAEGRDFGSWLQESVGSLTPTEEGWELLGVIRRLGQVIVTTNYDTLLEREGPEPARHKKWDAFTWTDDKWPSALEQKPVVLHLHGTAAKPQSVILSSADYQRIFLDQLDQAVSQYYFLSRRFLYIGCGDGLSDPHIAPLMRRVIEVLTARKGKQEQEDREHFILVRGGELRQLISDPLPEQISPVAYGAEFGQLAGFLRKLDAGLKPDVSQDPDDYEPVGSAVSAGAPSGPSGWADEAGRPAARPTEGELGADPPVTTLSLQVLADRQVQEALAAVRRAARAMDRVAGCVALPIGMTMWDPTDQETVHEQLAVSAAVSVASLNDRLREAANAVAAAADQAARTAARAEPGSALAPVRVAPTAAVLEALSAELAERVTLAHDDLAHRSVASSIRYRLLLPALEEAQVEAGDARRVAAELRQLLDRRPARGGTGQPGAGRASAAEPDPHARPPRQAEVPAAPVTVTGLTAPFLQPEAAVAAGLGTDRELQDEEPVPVTSDLARNKVIVMLVTGESMAGDDIHSGYYLVVDTQRSIAANEIAVFEKEGVGEGERFVKRVSVGEFEAHYRSSSPGYPEGTLTAADGARLIGKVIAVVRRIG
jgi:SIR2-like domain/Peptidase S24-like